MATEAAGKRAFEVLRPLCVQVMKAPTLEAARALDNALVSLPSMHPALMEYVTLPLRLILRQGPRCSAGLTECTLQCLSHVIRLVDVLQNWELFHELLSYACMMLDDKMRAEAGYSVLTDEHTLAATELAEWLCLKAIPNARRKLYSRLTELGHCISVLLGVAQGPRPRDVRRTAVLALVALSGANPQLLMDWVGVAAEPRLPEVCTWMGAGSASCSVFASFLPGISQVLANVVTSSDALGQTGIAVALLTWARLLIISVNAEEVVAGEEATPTEGPTTQLDTTPDPDATESLMVSRSGAWLSDTDAKLSLLVHRATSLVSHSGWRVRRAAVLWAYSLVVHCHRSLLKCVPLLLEVIVTLTMDEYKQVAEQAEKAMCTVSELFAREGGINLTFILEERLFGLASVLPRLMRQHDDARKQANLQLLAGFLRLLGPRVYQLTCSHSHLSHITLALVETLQLDTADQRILECSTVPASPAMLDTWSVPLRFHHFRSEAVEKTIYSVCRLLGAQGALSVVVDHLLDTLRASALYRKELCIVLSHVLLGAVESKELPGVVRTLVIEIIEPVYWQQQAQDLQTPPLTSGGGGSVLLSLPPPPRHECVCASDGEDVRATPAGGHLPCNGEAGCGYSSIHTLISTNADYLISRVGIHLRHLPQHPEVLRVLHAIISYGESTILPLIRDCMDEVFLLLDIQHCSESIWPLLHTLACRLAQWELISPSLLPASTTAEEAGEEGKRVGTETGEEEKPSAEEIKEFFLEYHKKNAMMEEGNEETLEEEGEEKVPSEDLPMNEEPTDDQPKLSVAHHTAVDILQRCSHHLATPSLSLKMVVLGSLQECLWVLQGQQQALLPEVHKVWPAFLLRLADEDPLVGGRALDVLLVMTRVCGDFLRRRVVQGVWPSLVRQLETLAKTSAQSDKLNRQTSAYKLQRKLLQNVGVLCEQLNIVTTDAELLLMACVPYLSNTQPEELQQACRDSLGYLARREPDCVWLFLSQLLSECSPPPHPSLKPYHFPRCSVSSHFASNVKSILPLTM
ncbi:hypothetical protein EMCRGX_G021207 [Ephydatia muelleri]